VGSKNIVIGGSRVENLCGFGDAGPYPLKKFISFPSVGLVSYAEMALEC